LSFDIYFKPCDLKPAVSGERADIRSKGGFRSKSRLSEPIFKEIRALH